jgi:hypothetical protein
VILRHRREAIKRPAGDRSRPDSYVLENLSGLGEAVEFEGGLDHLFG